MATIRQKKLAKEIISGTASTAKEMLLNVGYEKNVAEHKAKEILEGEGVQNELISLGFHPDKAKEVVGEILIAGENDTVKLKAADMVFKVHGTYAAEKHITLNIDESTQRTEELAHRLERLLGR